MSAQGAINFATDDFKGVSVFELLWSDMPWGIDKFQWKNQPDFSKL